MEASSPMFTIMYAIIVTFLGDCPMLGGGNPAISLGEREGMGVGGGEREREREREKERQTHTHSHAHLSLYSPCLSVSLSHSLSPSLACCWTYIARHHDGGQRQ